MVPLRLRVSQTSLLWGFLPDYHHAVYFYVPLQYYARMPGQNGVLPLQYCGKQSTIFWLSTQHFVPLHSNRLKLASDDPLLDVVFVDWLPHQSRAQVSAQCLIHQKDDAIIFSANAAGWLAVGDSLAQ